nr:hypothetical protein [Gammaproteobacteria bacterium]
LLGTFDLNGASTFVLTDKADGIVVADAVRLVQVSAPAPAATGIFYVHADHLGTPKTVTDAAQGIAWAADYLPYGEAQVTVEAVTLNVRFPGQYFDGETGLHYNYSRDYEPGLGRYIESDPFGFVGDLNTYRYASGNPINFTDARGLAGPLLPAIAACLSNPVCAGGAAAAIGGAIMAGSGSDDNVTPLPGAGEMIGGRFCPRGKCIRVNVRKETTRETVSQDDNIVHIQFGTKFVCEYKCASGRQGVIEIRYPEADPHWLEQMIDTLCPIQVDEGRFR